LAQIKFGSQNLAQQVKLEIPSDELKEDNEIDYIVLSGLHEKSINTIIKKKPQEAYFDALHPKILNFSNMKINNLNGIKNLTVDKSTITTLDISDNHLTFLDISYLLKELPNLKKINAEDCLITKVIFPKQLPPNMELFLFRNSIKDLPEFHMSEKGNFDIRGNPLSPNAHEKIRKALIPPFFKRNQHYLYLLKETYKKHFLFNSLIGTAASACLIWAPIGIIQGYKCEYPGYTPITVQLFLGFFSMPAYGIYKSEQLLGRLLSPSHEQFLQFVDKYSLASGFLIGASAVAWKLYKNKFEYKKHQYVQTAQIFTGDLDESAGI